MKKDVIFIKNGTPVPRIGVSVRWKWQKKPRSTKKNVDSPTHMMMEQTWNDLHPGPEDDHQFRWPVIAKNVCSSF